MLNKIKELEKQARKLEPSTEDRLGLDKVVQEYAHDFIDRIYEIKAYVVDEEKGKGIYDYPISDEPHDITSLIPIIEKNVDTPGLNPASGGHLGYIPGGGVYPTALGDYLADVFNRYAGVFFGSPGAVRMENMLIRWMAKILGFPETALGNLTSGGSIANLIAITTARDAKKITSSEVVNSCIYLTEQAHHSLQKAINIAGLRECQLRYVKMDHNFRMDAQALQQAIEKDKTQGLRPFLVIGSAGTTDTGVIDPLHTLAELCEKHDLWFHVDAAYGGFFILIDEVKDKYKGIERADSVTIDPHKGLFLAYGLGAVIIKNVLALNYSHQYQANYMQDTLHSIDEMSPADLSPELTKNFRGLRMWLPLQLFGVNTFKAAIAEKLWLCRYFYEKVQEIGFEVGPYPDLSVCIYRFSDGVYDVKAFNEQLVEEIRKDGRVFLSSTSLRGEFWIRIAILSFRSHLGTIDLCLQLLEKKKEQLLLQQNR